ncbi:MAG: nitroreductase family protein [Acetobacteraceae bacterium]|nr:nitroreductase family protein [Acetobacteraceae bacterium]
MTTVGSRTSDHEIDPIFLERWSPRAFTGEAMPLPVLMQILEAARWAPSAYNSQPWRFVYALRDSPSWANLLSLFVDGNRVWCQHAGALIVIASDSMMLPPGKDTKVPSHSHSFDTGSAFASLALQATKLGWHAHGMIGFDRERAFAELGFKEGYRVEAAVALGKMGNKEALPPALLARETPNSRKPLAETAFEGKFGG